MQKLVVPTDDGDVIKKFLELEHPICAYAYVLPKLVASFQQLLEKG